MAEIDLTAALSMLLSNRDCRRDFAHDRAASAEKLRLRPSDRAAFTSLDAHAIENQARTLLNKRYAEVAKLMPITMARLGDARTIFDRYAETNWPHGHQRHAIDAVQFAEYLARGCEPLEPCERNRVKFLLARKPFAAHLLWKRTRFAMVLPVVQLLHRNRHGIVRGRFIGFGGGVI